jgi:hypothetical protein
MKTFKEFVAESDNRKAFLANVGLFEHQVYKQIPGAKNSYRQDAGNTSTMTQKHAHVYAKLQGKGNQLYSVNFDGTGHDGASGKEIPSSHASHLRSLGYAIPDTNILENISFKTINELICELFIVEAEV